MIVFIKVLFVLVVGFCLGRAYDELEKEMNHENHH